MNSSDEAADGIKLLFDEVTDISYLVGSYKVSQDENLDQRVTGWVSVLWRKRYSS